MRNSTFYMTPKKCVLSIWPIFFQTWVYFYQPFSQMRTDLALHTTVLYTVYPSYCNSRQG